MTTSLRLMKVLDLAQLAWYLKKSVSRGKLASGSSSWYIAKPEKAEKKEFYSIFKKFNLDAIKMHLFGVYFYCSEKYLIVKYISDDASEM